MSGPLFHLVVAALCLWIATLLSPGVIQGFLVASAILQLQSLFVSLYPFCFLEMDGYHVLVEWLGLPTLNHDAVRFVRESLWARLRNLDSLTRRERIYVAYFALSLVSVTGIVVATVWFLVYAGDRERRAVRDR